MIFNGLLNTRFFFSNQTNNVKNICIIEMLQIVYTDNIQVKFFLENDKGLEIWKAYGRFSKLDVHHQYAIVFK